MNGWRDAPARGAESVSFLLDVLPNPKHALFYPARELGFFRDAGINVEIGAGKGSADVIQLVASGSATFGFADAGAVALARSRGIPITLIGMVHYKTLMSIITRAGSGVKTPKDLAGKSIATTSGDSVRTLFPAFASINGIDEGAVTFVTASHSAKSGMLLEGHVDGVCDYLSAFPIYKKAAKQVGIDLSALSYGDYGISIYSNGIIASDSTLKDAPDKARAFMKGIIRALNFAAQSPAEAANIFQSLYKDYDQEVTREGLDIALQHLLVPEAKASGLGHMSSERMAETVQMTVNAYHLNATVPTSTMFSNSYLS